MPNASGIIGVEQVPKHILDRFIAFLIRLFLHHSERMFVLHETCKWLGDKLDGLAWH